MRFSLNDSPNTLVIGDVEMRVSRSRYFSRQLSLNGAFCTVHLQIIHFAYLTVNVQCNVPLIQDASALAEPLVILILMIMFYDVNDMLVRCII